MSNAERAKEIIDKLPEDTSLHEIAQKIEFVAAVQEGFDQIDAGKGVSLEKVESMIESWATK
ncbi:MAG: hypothetical protein MI748_07495 [Opitutales bacterium]|nr:hypothetical protein [Opitutales bacterium]